MPRAANPRNVKSQLRDPGQIGTCRAAGNVECTFTFSGLVAFRREIGLTVVVQNIVSSQFNSSLVDSIRGRVFSLASAFRHSRCGICPGGLDRVQHTTTQPEHACNRSQIELQPQPA
jgi:hypothetical protein